MSEYIKNLDDDKKYNAVCIVDLLHTYARNELPLRETAGQTLRP
jgi:hypothetical protein